MASKLLLITRNEWDCGKRPYPDSVRATFVILFSALLVLTQSVVPGDAALAKFQPCCSQCACSASCCAAAPNSNSAPLPAAPAPTVSLKQIQCALAVAALILPPQISPAPKISPSAASSFRSDALPLYERNCIYLI